MWAFQLTKDQKFMYTFEEKSKSFEVILYNIEDLKSPQLVHNTGLKTLGWLYNNDKFMIVSYNKGEVEIFNLGDKSSVPTSSTKISACADGYAESIVFSDKFTRAYVGCT